MGSEKMKNLSKILLLIMVFTIIISSIPINQAFANTTVYLNEKAKVPITIQLGKAGAGFYSLSTGQKGAVGDPINDKYVSSFTANAEFTPTSLGNYKITLTLDVADSSANPINVAAKTVTVNVVNRPASPKPKPPVIDDTEREKIEADKKLKEELEKRMKTPVITGIELISNSDRLRGEKIGEIETEAEKFDYTYVLPRNIDNIKFRITTIKDDVELEFNENIILEKDKDDLELVIKATQDKLKQEFKIKFSKSQESKFSFIEGGKVYEQISDSLLDKSMEDLGFEKTLINKEDPSEGFYYLLDNNRYIVVTDEENKGYIFLLDERNNKVREVLLVSNAKNKVSILVNETLEEDDRLLKTNGYEDHEFEFSNLITDIDKGIEFKNTIKGWIYEDAIITHGLDQDGKANLVHLDKSGDVKFAFIEFDKPLDKFSKLITYGGYGLWIITLLIFIIFVVKSKKETEGAYSKH